MLTLCRFVGCRRGPPLPEPPPGTPRHLGDAAVVASSCIASSTFGGGFSVDVPEVGDVAVLLGCGPLGPTWARVLAFGPERAKNTASLCPPMGEDSVLPFP